jgi:hypothetical protein
LANLFIPIIVGILASFAFNRYARAWFPMQIGVIADSTSALVGIAGAFIGLHIGIVLGLSSWPLAAVSGTFATMWGWHRWM